MRSTLPACIKCRSEDKTCFYDKSRRGIRDPQKRSLISDKPIIPTSVPSQSFPSPEVAGLDIAINVESELPGGWSVRRPSLESSPGSLLFDLHYTYFHHTHPWVLPREFSLRKICADPQTFDFVAVDIAYIARCTAASSSSHDIREKAFTMACGPLPMTPWTIQGILALNIAAFGEDKSDLSDGWLDRATQIAVDIGMQRKGFADSEPDWIIAESYRRTFWALYLHGTLRALRQCHPSFALFSVPVTTDLRAGNGSVSQGGVPA
jgi:Fungal specific transcription factor domain